jgi:predicted RNA-binding Zn-ribbon protein involved in translation (DUF1610 family)
MAFETKEQILEQLMEQVKPKCPHCGEEMNLWEVPPITCGDGLGWGTPYLYICFNDECPLYIEGWKNLEENYAHKASYRCLCYPGTETFECLPVFSQMGGRGQIIDNELIAQQEALKEATKKGFSVLANCYVEKDWITVVRLLVDPTQPARVRVKSAEMLGDFGDLESIEPLRNFKFGNEILQKQVDESIGKIHDRFFTRECPFCAEIIKRRAKVCKHCGKEVSGL